MKDQEIVWLDQLESEGRIETPFNRWLLSNGDSREPEMAGIWGAVVGSFYMMLIVLALSVPLGVGAAIYLEEFAPKNNRWVDIIEVNINNLAAVPSIVFGLLGLAVFLGVMGLPRSAPLVGGLTLTLMTLPTIVVATRAALRGVPPSIREGALGIGASKVQVVAHHVLPLALPGILTGTIIGLAQALGETAPLLMIGMVAFIVDIPSGPLDAATALPVQIFLWADSPGTRLHRTLGCSDHGAPGLPDPDEHRRCRSPSTVQHQVVNAMDTQTLERSESARAVGQNPASLSNAADSRMTARKVNLWYGEKQALFDVGMDIPDREVTALIGPSGCGKSTFLRCLNRMNDTIDICRVEGDICLDGLNIYDRKVDPVQLRARVGMVFQKPNPFPKSIYDNIAYGPIIHGLAADKAELDEMVESSLKGAGLWEEVKDRLGGRRATALSGGQQQRLCASLARSR